MNKCPHCSCGHYETLGKTSVAGVLFLTCVCRHCGYRFKRKKALDPETNAAKDEIIEPILKVSGENPFLGG